MWCTTYCSNAQERASELSSDVLKYNFQWHPLGCQWNLPGLKTNGVLYGR